MRFQPVGLLPRGSLLAFAAFITWLAYMNSPLGLFDRAVHDAMLRAGPALQPPADIVIIDIDEASLQAIGPWPWPRAVVAELMQRIDNQGPRLQAWDIFFPEPMPGDDKLATVISSALRPVVLGQVLVLDPNVQSAPQLGERVAWGQWPDEACSRRLNQKLSGHLGLAPTLAQSGLAVGHLSATPEADGRLRRLPAVVCADGRQYPQFALAVAAAAEGDLASKESTPWKSQAGHSWLRLGALQFPIDSEGQIPVPFLYPHTAWQAVSASSLLLSEPLSTGLAGRMVLVGATALGVGDRVVSPFHPNAPGVTVHAELLAAASTGRWPLPLAYPLAYAMGLVVVLLGLGLQQLRRPRSAMSLAFTALGLLFLPVFLAAATQLLGSTLMPIAAPLLGVACGILLFLLVQVDLHRRQVQRLASHLQSFLPVRLAQEIARQDPSGESLGRPGEGLIVAMQVRGLDRWTQGVDSLKALAFVHALSSLADRIAREHGGQLEYRHGDCLYLVFARNEAKAKEPAAIEELVQQLLKGMQPLTQANETLQRPLGLQVAAEQGSFLLAVAGAKGSRRPLLLGPVLDSLQSILGLAEELASPVVLGPDLVQSGSASFSTAEPLGHFLLPNQSEPKMLYRMPLPEGFLPLPIVQPLPHPLGSDERL